MAGKREKFADKWVNQTALGKRFGLSAIAIGKLLRQFGLKGTDNQPTPKALAEGFCTSTLLRDGRPFHLWEINKILKLLKEEGYQPKSKAELEIEEAVQTILAALEHIERGEAKYGWLLIEETTSHLHRHQLEPVNRKLAEAGVSFRLGPHDLARQPDRLPGNPQEKIGIACQHCGNILQLRRGKVVPCDFYVCGPCSHTYHPQVATGLILVILHNAAGPYVGYRQKVPSQAESAAVERARGLLRQGLAEIAATESEQVH